MRIGVPTTRTLDRLNDSAADSNARKTRWANGPTDLFAMPGFAFGSRITRVTSAHAAARIIIGLVYPPTPMTKSARLDRRIRRHCHKLTGMAHKPVIAPNSPLPITGLAPIKVRSNPSWASTFDSSPRAVPTKSNLVAGSRRRNSRANATAG